MTRKNPPTVKLTRGRSSAIRSGSFSAKWPGVCERCGKPIERFDEVRYHHDFSGVVHDGCCRPVRIRRTPVATGTRMPMMCPECHLEHSGPCW